MQLIKLEELIKSQLLMSSKDISELTGKSVSHVNRDIKCM